MTGTRPRALLAGVLQVLNVAAAVAWWRLAPGQAFELRTGILIGVLSLAWTAVVLSRRSVLNPREALWVIGLGVSLPLVWMIAIVMSEVAVVFAITTLIFGFFFVALCPLILWGAFVVTHSACNRLSRILVAEQRAG